MALLLVAVSCLSLLAQSSIPTPACQPSLLQAGSAKSKRLQDTQQSSQFIKQIWYVNMEHSAERRATMAAHLAKVGLPFTRFPALSFRTTAESNASEVDFTEQDRQLMQTVFGDWNCGKWKCAAPDIVCCLGYRQALQLYCHSNERGFSPVRGTNYLGNLASHVMILKEIRDTLLQEDEAKGAVIIAEDDVRFPLDWDWKSALEDSLAEVGDWDLLRLYSFSIPELPFMNRTECLSEETVCGKHHGQCLVRMVHGKCTALSTGALLINLAKIPKILHALERQSRREHTRLLLRKPSQGLIPPDQYSIDLLLTNAVRDHALNVFASHPSIAYIDDAASKKAAMK